MDKKPDGQERVPGTGSRVRGEEPLPEDGTPVSDDVQQPPALACPDCGDQLAHVHTEVSSGAFRTQAASMPQLAIHFYDCPECQTCWKFGTRLLPDPVRQTLRG